MKHHFSINGMEFDVAFEKRVEVFSLDGGTPGALYKVHRTLGRLRRVVEVVVPATGHFGDVGSEQLANLAALVAHF
jgi:hypothetical protein